MTLENYKDVKPGDSIHVTLVSGLALQTKLVLSVTETQISLEDNYVIEIEGNNRLYLVSKTYPFDIRRKSLIYLEYSKVYHHDN